MKIVHIESGLGNQMLSYCEYLALQKSNPGEKIYIETSIYEIPECFDTLSQWNGYELQRIFGIDAPNIKDILTGEQWEAYLNDVRESRFWEKNWNYPRYITEALRKQGIELENIRGDFEAPGALLMTGDSTALKSRIGHTLPGYWLKKALREAKKAEILKEVNEREKLFLTTDRPVFTGQRLSFKYVGNGIERIDKEIRESFVFPEITDERNLELLSLIRNTNSVGIHARRGDMLNYNMDFYRFGFFKRAVKYIKKNVSDPVFIFFSDPGSCEWSRNNPDVYSLRPDKDRVYFADWNKGTESYRDMQLMAECRHQITTNSTFGWWAAYLNRNPDKITCAPDFTINTTNYF